MEISTVPSRARPLPARWRVLAALAILLPVSLFALLPTGLGLQRYVISGTSMSGSIDRGSVVFERSVPSGDLRAGDVITFTPPSGFAARGLVTHRIVSIEAGQIVTQGDANHFRDPWSLPAGGSQSRVILTLPWVGHPFLADIDRGMWLLLVLGPLAMVLVAVSAGGAAGPARRHRRHGAPTVARSNPR